MQILTLGGTQFVGRHIVEACLAAGHAVSILTRGHTPDTLPPSVEQLRGDRDAGTPGLEALVGRTIPAALTLTDPAITVCNTRAWSLRIDLPPALSPPCEAELIRRAAGLTAYSQTGKVPLV